MRTPHLQAAANVAEADVDLMQRLAAGDRDAVAELYDRHAARVLGLAYRVVRNSSDAEDVVQEVFSQAWRTAPNYNPARGTVAGWLLMMARTRAIDRLRARQARRDAGGDPDLDVIPSDAASLPEQRDRYEPFEPFESFAVVGGYFSAGERYDHCWDVRQLSHKKCRGLCVKKGAC